MMFKFIGGGATFFQGTTSIPDSRVYFILQKRTQWLPGGSSTAVLRVKIIGNDPDADHFRQILNAPVLF